MGYVPNGHKTGGAEPVYSRDGDFFWESYGHVTALFHTLSNTLLISTHDIEHDPGSIHTSARQGSPFAEEPGRCRYYIGEEDGDGEGEEGAVEGYACG